MLRSPDSGNPGNPPPRRPTPFWDPGQLTTAWKIVVVGVALGLVIIGFLLVLMIDSIGDRPTGDEVERIVRGVPPVPTATPIPTAAPPPTLRPTLSPVPKAYEVLRWAYDAVPVVQNGDALGSGFIFDADNLTGFVITAYHVVDEDTEIVVHLPGGASYEAELLGFDPRMDVAVLSICCSLDFVVLPWDEGASVLPGDPVVQMGHAGEIFVPEGHMPSVVLGMVKHDSLSEDVEGVVAHDADLGVGSSGGPLLSLDGEVLGMTFGRLPGIAYSTRYEVVADKINHWKGLVRTVQR